SKAEARLPRHLPYPRQVEALRAELRRRAILQRGCSPARRQERGGPDRAPELHRGGREPHREPGGRSGAARADAVRCRRADARHAPPRSPAVAARGVGLCGGLRHNRAMRRLLALGLVLIPPAHAQTYKWVDERGVVNYSNTLPPSAAKKIQPVADRISTYDSDPWLQRQRLMATAQHQQATYAAYPYSDYAYGYPYYYGPVLAAGVTRAPRASRPPHVAHHRGSSRF